MEGICEKTFVIQQSLSLSIFDHRSLSERNVYECLQICKICLLFLLRVISIIRYFKDLCTIHCKIALSFCHNE